MAVKVGGGEFSWGEGLVSPPGRGGVPTLHDRHRARFITDQDNPDADENAVLELNATQSRLEKVGEVEGVYVAGHLRGGATPMVTQDGPVPTTGQFRKIDPSLPKGGHNDHHADGMQDGSGDAWRASLPPNPVTEG